MTHLFLQMLNKQKSIFVLKHVLSGRLKWFQNLLLFYLKKSLGIYEHINKISNCLSWLDLTVLHSQTEQASILSLLEKHTPSKVD